MCFEYIYKSKKTIKMELGLYRSADCRQLYEEIKNAIIEHLQQNTERFYIITTKENFGFQNQRWANPPVVNDLYQRIFEISFHDMQLTEPASTKREIKIVNQRENRSDTLFIVENNMGRVFKIADPLIEHNIPYYTKLFVDVYNEAQFQEAVSQDHQQRRIALASAMHERLGGRSGLLGEVLRTGVFDQ